ncbi:MAG: MFS transporter [Rhodobacterales bacterium CG_4_9_14_3_um_filter_71_31]|nr:MAG: MFS transporter [Rhodobacterales bacterium CG_4_9_14_3_um_filter_71_31]
MTGESRLGVVLTLGTAQTLAWGSTYYLPAILAVPMARDMGVSTTWIFGAFSLALVVSALLGPWAGRRIDLFGGRAMLLASSIAFAAGLALLGLAQGPATLALGWLVIGLGMGVGLYEAAFASLVTLYGRDARGPITGVTLIAGLASTICWPITALIDAEMGWRAACFFWAAAHLALGLPLNLLASPRPAAAPDAAPETPTGAISATAAPSEPAAPPQAGRAMALMAFAFAVTWFVSTAMAAHLPRLLQEAGAAPAAALLAAALVGPAQVAGRLLEFGLLRRSHPLLSARLAGLAHPLGAAALLALGAPAAIFFTVAHGLGNGVLTIAKGSLPLAVFGPGGYGRRLGLLMAPARVAQAAAPLAFAGAVEVWGAGAFALSAGLSLAGLAALMALRAAPRA